MIRFIIEALDLNPEDDVAYITFTGKAASVLRDKGCPNAMTAHRLLYYSKQLPNGSFLFTPRITLDKDYKLLVVDEVSMLPLDMWELLLSHHIHVIASGDPFQLSPIDKSKDNHILDNPDVFLEEVMRQAKESDIIRLSMDIREQKPIKPFKGNDVQVFYRKDLISGMYFWADQIICATNRTRNDINSFMRREMGRGMEPEVGDKIICGRNCYEVASANLEYPLFNGTIGYIKEFEKTENKYFISYNSYYAPILRTTFSIDEDEYIDVDIDYNSLTKEKKFFTSKQEYAIRKNKKNTDKLPIEFNYGYSITAHRAQGSQFSKVLVLEERFPFDKVEHAKWLYTSTTRAIDRLTLILNE